MQTVSTAAIQMNSQPNLDYNLNRAYKWISEAAGLGAEFIVLPENFAFLGNEKERLRQAETIAKKSAKSLSVWAEEFGVFLLAGGYPYPAGDNKVYNRAEVYNPNGEVISRYDKVHLFDVDLSDQEQYRESDMVKPGSNKTVVCEINHSFRAGLSICYDIRFPELYRKLVTEGANLLTIPAAFTKPTGEAHWEVLLRARAIENTSYVIAPAQTGLHGDKRKTYGHAMIIDPWGNILADAGTKPGVVTAELDTEVIEEVRRKIPSLKHRVM